MKKGKRATSNPRRLRRRRLVIEFVNSSLAPVEYTDVLAFGCQSPVPVLCLYFGDDRPAVHYPLFSILRYTEIPNERGYEKVSTSSSLAAQY
jgi:hypothetical protein